MEQKQPLQQMVLGELDSYMQKNETLAPTYTIRKNKFKVHKRFYISCDTTNVLEENIGRKISDIPCSNIFTNISPRARGIKEIISKWDFIKIKSFCTAKENKSKMNGDQLYGKMYLPMIPSTRVCSLKYIKN